MMTVREEYEAFKKVLHETKAKMADITKKLLQEEFQQIFAEHPKLHSFSWQQYTPYFNDGDTCEFSVNDVYDENVVFEGEDEDPDPANDPEKRIIAQKVSEIICSMESDDMLATFDDHTEVTVTKDGMTISEYEHD